jgi:beta-galactosidase
VDADGVVQGHGSRQHACHSSEVFRAYCRKITQAMAEHFADNPHVVGWQTDNEFHCHFSECHCPSCQKAFAEFLRQRHDNDIDALNAAWGTAFWAQTYRAFEDIPTPRRMKPTYVNPAHWLDYCRFLSDNVASFQREQVEILRRVNPDWFIFHNGTMRHIDYRGSFTRDLDFLGFDAYPFFNPQSDTRHMGHALHLERTRCWSGNFIIPEHQSGPGGQGDYFHDTPQPGDIRRLSYCSVARGADGLLYFRWRSCRFGAEEYWLGIIDHDNVPRRRFEEIREIGAAMAKIGPEIMGSSVFVDTGIAACDHAVTEGHDALGSGLPAADSVAADIFFSLYPRHIAAGLVHPSDDLGGLKLYFIPHWEVFDPAWVPRLEEWVRAGGVLVIGARSATRDLNNNVVAETPPGCLRGLAGCRVYEYGKVNDHRHFPLDLRFGKKGKIPAQNWYEALLPDKGARVLATWSGVPHLGGAAAVTRRKLGKGRVYYIGTFMRPELMRVLVPALLKRANVQPIWPGLPREIEAVKRVREDGSIWFFINHGMKKIRLERAPKGVELISGKKVRDSLDIEPKNARVIRTTKTQKH